jgi:molecular chaperone HscB
MALYRDLQQEQRRIAENISSTITHAYSTLQNPLSRAAYLLNHLDPPVPITESSKLSDPELLMTVLEVREAIEGASTPEEVDVIKQENQERITQVQSELSKAFGEGRAEDARDRTIELRYWEGLRKACDDWEPGKRVELVHDD